MNRNTSINQYREIYNLIVMLLYWYKKKYREIYNLIVMLLYKDIIYNMLRHIQN